MFNQPTTFWKTTLQTMWRSRPFLLPILLFGMFTASAAAQSPVQLSVETASVNPDADIVVAITADVAVDTQLGFISLELAYDPTVLSIETGDCQRDPGGTFDVGFCNETFEAGKIRLNGGSFVGTNGTIVLANLTFRAIGADGTSSPLTLSVREINDPATGATLDTTITNGQVTVENETLIVLASFNAMVTDDTTTLTWTTAAEIDNAGFNIYRSNSADGPWVKVNDALIPAEGSPFSSTSYTFTDSADAAYYMLEDVDINGFAAPHPPVAVNESANSLGGATSIVFIPLAY
ncbi:MAG: cohesin domain-containing protein [Chloroflexota bacterium]